jgi:hypothetical protein
VPATVALTLIGATYVESTSVELTFDRAIDIGAIDVSAIVVSDHVIGFRYQGAGVATAMGLDAVYVELVGLDEWTGSSTTLTASPANGITAAGDGAAWAGVTDAALPFG